MVKTKVVVSDRKKYALQVVMVPDKTSPLFFFLLERHRPDVTGHAIDPGAVLRAATTHSGRSAGEGDQLLIANVIKGEVRSGARGGRTCVQGGGV